MAINIIIADDHKLFREGLVNLLEETEEIKVIDEAKSGQDVIEKTGLHNPDVILMDIVMPDMSGVSATRAIRKEHPGIKVIALTMHTEKHFIKEMLKAGASGYLFKDCSYNQLIEAIISVNKGSKYLSSEVTNVVVTEYLHNSGNRSGSDNNLTEREEEILKLYAEGNTTRQISEMLYVSVKTVGTHKQNILKKLDLKNETDLIKYALKKGIISLD